MELVVSMQWQGSYSSPISSDSSFMLMVSLSVTGVNPARSGTSLNISGDEQASTRTRTHTHMHTHMHMDLSLTARAPSSESPAAPAAASSAARRGRGDVAFQSFNCSTQDRLLDVFHRHNHAFFHLLRSTRREAPAEQETLDEFPDPRSPECRALKVLNASSMEY